MGNDEITIKVQLPDVDMGSWVDIIVWGDKIDKIK